MKALSSPALEPIAAKHIHVPSGTPPTRSGATTLTFAAEAAALSTAEHALCAAGGDCYDAWRRVNGDAKEGDGESFAADEDLVKDGDALLGSLVFTRDAKYQGVTYIKKGRKTAAEEGGLGAAAPVGAVVDRYVRRSAFAYRAVPELAARPAARAREAWMRQAELWVLQSVNNQLLASRRGVVAS